ncbi:hypothetical protein L227DRAFT_570739, partial [Lentinus tigrinus ALCF2SS1-6]
MREIRIVWGTGQVRATYPLRDAVSYCALRSRDWRVKHDSVALLTRVWLTSTGILQAYQT